MRNGTRTIIQVLLIFQVTSMHQASRISEPVGWVPVSSQAHRLRGLGDLERTGEDRSVKRAYLGRPTGRRPVGHPKYRWAGRVGADLHELGAGETWREKSQDRARWRPLVPEPKTHSGSLRQIKVSPNPDLRPIVHTRAACFRGLQAQDGDYSMFLGIPYARVDPENVFGPAIPHTFEGVYDAVDDSARCPQIAEHSKTIEGTLDCLNVNIYVPNSASINNPLPVLVYVFGGAFRFGDASKFIYGPRFIVRHDVIFVIFNYRLGPYGLMCLNTSKVPGNEGLKDQVKALRWVKENIHYFGGDDSKITVMGHSAGSISLDLHQYFLREQLYHRVIVQDGVALTYAVFEKDPDTEAPFKLAEHLNYTTNDIHDALSYLNSIDPHELIAATRDSGVEFKLCVEKQIENSDNYITKYPVNINKVKDDVDVLIGFNNDEGYVKFTIMEDGEFESTDFISHYVNSVFEFRNESKLSDEIIKIVRQFYYGDEAHRADNRKPAMNAFSDFFYYSPILRTIEKYLDSGVENIYFYMYSYSGERSFNKNLRNVSHTEGGAAHADEIGYLFDISYMKQLFSDEDILIIDRMTELWTNFVKYGNPTPSPSKLIPLQWPRVNQSQLPYLEINTQLRLGSRPMHERMSFMDLLFKAYGQYQKRFNVTKD